MASHNELGAWGERYVAHALRLRGHAITIPGKRADLHCCAAGLEIEVKTALPSRYNGSGIGYQFCIHRQNRRGLQGHIVVLLCIDPQSWQTPHIFIVPAWRIDARRKIGIPIDVDRYTGQWACYRGRWDVIKSAAAELGAQPPERGKRTVLGADLSAV